jgi:hypothetical protein
MGSRRTNWEELFYERSITEAVYFTENNRPIGIAPFTKESMLQSKPSSIMAIRSWRKWVEVINSQPREKDMTLGVVILALFSFRLLQLIFLKSVLINLYIPTRYQLYNVSFI